jgi:hypothetical protein
MTGSGTEITQHPLAQALGFAHIDDHAPAISHEITTGAVGNGLKPLSEKLVQTLSQFFGCFLGLLFNVKKFVSAHTKNTIGNFVYIGVFKKDLAVIFYFKMFTPHCGHSVIDFSETHHI